MVIIYKTIKIFTQIYNHTMVITTLTVREANKLIVYNMAAGWIRQLKSAAPGCSCRPKITTDALNY